MSISGDRGPKEDYVIKTPWEKGFLLGSDRKKKISIGSEGQLKVNIIAQSRFYRIINSVGKLIPHWKSKGNIVELKLERKAAKSFLDGFDHEIANKVIYVQRVNLFNAIGRLQIDAHQKIAELENKITESKDAKEVKKLENQITEIKKLVNDIKEYDKEIGEVIQTSKDEHNDIADRYSPENIYSNLTAFREQYEKISPKETKAPVPVSSRKERLIPKDKEQKQAVDSSRNLWMAKRRLPALEKLSQKLEEFWEKNGTRIASHFDSNQELREFFKQLDENERELNFLITRITEKKDVNADHTFNCVNNCNDLMKKIEAKLGQLPKLQQEESRVSIASEEPSVKEREVRNSDLIEVQLKKEYHQYANDLRSINNQIKYLGEYFDVEFLEDKFVDLQESIDQFVQSKIGQINREDLQSHVAQMIQDFNRENHIDVVAKQNASYERTLNKTLVLIREKGQGERSELNEIQNKLNRDISNSNTMEELYSALEKATKDLKALHKQVQKEELVVQKSDEGDVSLESERDLMLERMHQDFLLLAKEKRSEGQFAYAYELEQKARTTIDINDLSDPSIKGLRSFYLEMQDAKKLNTTEQFLRFRELNADPKDPDYIAFKIKNRDLSELYADDQKKQLKALSRHLKESIQQIEERGGKLTAKELERKRVGIMKDFSRSEKEADGDKEFAKSIELTKKKLEELKDLLKILSDPTELRFKEAELRFKEAALKNK